jgi:hypothetical protein
MRAMGHSNPHAIGRTRREVVHVRYPSLYAAHFATAQFRHLSQFCELTSGLSRTASPEKRRFSPSGRASPPRVGWRRADNAICD